MYFNGAVRKQLGWSGVRAASDFIPQLDEVGEIELLPIADSPAKKMSTQIPAECLPIMLPPSMSKTWQGSETNCPVIEEETQLRIGVANDALGEIRNSVGILSFQYQTGVRPASTQRQVTRAYSAITGTLDTLWQHVQVYMDSRKALGRLHADLTVFDHFKPLTKQDLKASTTIIDLSNPHTVYAQLVWFWTMDRPSESDSSNPMWKDECEKLSS
ncbi:hypothetical protein OF83DRAFT_1089183 [Amylostereum chailletii]|nr:hypothetical protein OF83DRAFT_1089183 [Amylostereum chailletii]